MRSRKLWIFINAIAIAVGYAMLMRWLYGLETWGDLWEVMTVTFLLLVPMAVGAITVYLSNVERVKHPSYRIMAPWIPIGLFFLITTTLYIEGWACWLMIMIPFLIVASIGGLIGGYFKLRRKRGGNTHISLFAILPLLLSPLESLVEFSPGTYSAYTYIDIQSRPELIWGKVTHVAPISKEMDNGRLSRFMGLPRPLYAELDFAGVGGYRKAVFDKGLVFHETVTEYIESKRMVFSIKAIPHEIPSTTLDEHILIGGKFFDVLEGIYELEQLDEGACRLHLWSTYKLNTNFNFFSSLWARWIMKDIQQNILGVIKIRAEGEMNSTH